jgi:uncharacterized membrane protein
LLLRRILVAGIVFAAFVVLLATTPSLLPSGTDRGSLITRAVTGLLIGVVLVFVVRRVLRALVMPPPPPPATVDARSSDLVYVCAVCGTRVRLEVAATAKPPKHCGEEMEAIVT